MRLSKLLEREPLSLWRTPGVKVLEGVTTGAELMNDDDGGQYVLCGTEPRRLHRLEASQPEPQPVLVEVVIASRVSDVFERLTNSGRRWLLSHVAVAVRATEQAMSQHRLVLPIPVPPELALGEAMNALFAVAIGRDRSADGWPDEAAVSAFLIASIERAIRDYTQGALTEAKDRENNALATVREAANTVARLAKFSACLRDPQTLTSTTARLQLAAEVAKQLESITSTLEGLCES